MPRYKSRRLAPSGYLILFLRDLVERCDLIFYLASDSMSYIQCFYGTM